MHWFFDWLFFKIIKVSGLFGFVGLFFTALSAGNPGETKYFWLGNAMFLVMLIVARIESHREQKQHDRQEIEDLQTKLEELKSSLSRGV